MTIVTDCRPNCATLGGRCFWYLPNPEVLCRRGRVLHNTYATAAADSSLSSSSYMPTR
jgi:hypothetical protein